MYPVAKQQITAFKQLFPNRWLNLQVNKFFKKHRELKKKFYICKLKIQKIDLFKF